MKTKRLANIELLRVIAMVMIVILHFLSHTDSLISLSQDITLQQIIGTVLEFLCLSAVNTYVFISGYYGVKSQYRPSKAIQLLLRIWFYALLIPLVLLALRAAGVSYPFVLCADQGIYGWIQYLFPIETEHYWFATAFFMLYLLTPLLNKAAHAVTKQQFQVILVGLFILFCGIKSFSPVVFAFDKYGYDLPWFLCVYLLAAYSRLYGIPLLSKNCTVSQQKRRGLALYFASAAAALLVQFVTWAAATKINMGFSYYFTVPYHYNSLLALTGAIGLFAWFSNLELKEGKATEVIRRLGGLSFGIYLLHEHIDIRYVWYDWLKAFINPHGAGIGWFFAELIGCVVLICVAGLLMDYVRSLLFRILAKPLAATKLGIFIAGLDQIFAKEGSEIAK